jgi:flagellar motility protein MotE (MotC chaperone)
MNAPSAALILANMDAEKAYSVSLLLAGRNVDRP